MSDYKQHPLSAAFPAMAPADHGALVDDIRDNGQLKEIVLFEEMILDGWHRYLACRTLSLSPRFEYFSGQCPKKFVRSVNLHRRHLTASQKAAAAVATENWQPAHRPRVSPPTDNNSALGAELPSSNRVTPISVGDLAREIGVGTRTIEHAKAAQQGGKAVQEAVVNGQISAKRGAEIAQMPPNKREAALASPPAPKSKPAPPPLERSLVDDLQDAHQQIAHMEKLIASLQKTDAAKEITVWQGKFEGACQRINQLCATESELTKSVKYYKGIVEKACKVLNVKTSEVLPALMALKGEG